MVEKGIHLMSASSFWRHQIPEILDFSSSMLFKFIFSQSISPMLLEDIHINIKSAGSLETVAT